MWTHPSLVGAACIPSRDNVPYFSRLVIRGAAPTSPVGNFIAFLFYAPFYGKVGALSLYPHSSRSSSPLVGTGEKSMGSVRAESLAVIGYIFIIIYSNRKRYLGMGMYGYGGMGLLGDPRSRSQSSGWMWMMMLGRCKRVFVSVYACLDVQ